MTIADAPPPPLQMLAQPITPSFCFKTLYNEQIILAPDDLIGGRERGGGGHSAVKWWVTGMGRVSLQLFVSKIQASAFGKRKGCRLKRN